MVEDPNYTPAAAVEITQAYNSEYSMDGPDIIVLEDEPVEEEHHTLTLGDDGLEISITDSARKSLIAILVVIGVILVWCFGCGCFVLCVY